MPQPNLGPDIATSALVIVDMQNDFLHPDGGFAHRARENPDVLLLSYEHMTVEPEANMRRLAAFCGIALDDDLLALTLERSSLAFMLAHKDRFDDLMMRKVSEERGRLPAGGRNGRDVGQGHNLKAGLRRLLRLGEGAAPARGVRPATASRWGQRRSLDRAQGTLQPRSESAGSRLVLFLRFLLGTFSA